MKRRICSCVMPREEIVKPVLRVFLLSVLIGLGVALVGGFAYTRLRPYAFHGSVIQSQNPAPDFTLQGADGPVSLRDFRGKTVLLFFGYSFCPDVCPTTMSDLAKTMSLLGRQADRYQVIMVSVDPERDTPEKIDAYAKHFDERFLGLSGSPEDVAQVATLYGIYYQKQEGTAASGYLVDHTATVMVIDRKGYLRLLLPFGTAPEDIAADLQHIR